MRSRIIANTYTIWESLCSDSTPVQCNSSLRLLACVKGCGFESCSGLWIGIPGRENTGNRQKLDNLWQPGLQIMKVEANLYLLSYHNWVQQLDTKLFYKFQTRSLSNLCFHFAMLPILLAILRFVSIKYCSIIFGLNNVDKEKGLYKVTVRNVSIGFLTCNAFNIFNIFIGTSLK